MKDALKKLLIKFYARDLIIYLIRKMEKQGWTKGVDLPEEIIADRIVAWLNGQELSADEIYMSRGVIRDIVANI